MSIIQGLRKFDAIAFVEIHQKIQSIENQITAYHAQKNTINHLAKAFFFSSAALAVKLVWNKIGGTDLKIAATSSSSVVLGLLLLLPLEEHSGGWTTGKRKQKTSQVRSRSFMESHKKSSMEIPRAKRGSCYRT